MMIFNDTPGDAERLDGFFREHELLLYKYARSILGEHALAEDALQNSLERVICAYDTVREFEDTRLMAYLWSVVRHECGRIIETRRREIPSEYAELWTQERTPAVDEFARLGDKQMLQAAIGKLENSQRTAIVMKYFNDADDRMIAAVVGIRPDSVRMLLSRARAALRKYYTEQEKG